MKQLFTHVRSMILCIVLLSSYVSFGQLGTLDTSFDVGAGANLIYCMAQQADGKIIIGGHFTTYNGIAQKRVARLNTDGSLDTTFNVGTGANSYVQSVAVQPDGKILIGGSFSTYNGVARKRIARLNTDGSLDTTFNPGTGANSVVLAFAFQPDNKIIIGGSFSQYNDISKRGVARLNTDGSLDTTLDIAALDAGSIYSLALQPDGKIIAGGSFLIVPWGTARYNTDGSLDETFNTGTDTNFEVKSVLLQPDGKIVIGGFFSDFDGITRQEMARLNADGTLDISFDPGLGPNDDITCMALQPDGKIIIGGWFSYYNMFARLRIARVNANGSLDTTFNVGTGLDDIPWNLGIDADGKVLAAGWFTTYNDASANGVVRLCNSAKPEGQTQQQITANGQATLADIEVAGNNIIWYDASGNVLPLNTTLVNNTTYYATQTIGECESAKLAVTVQVTLGTNVNQSIKFSYYPNPVANNLHIVSANIIEQVEVYNLMGQIVLDMAFNATEGDIDMHSLAAGSYMVRVQSGNEAKTVMVIKAN